jgi:hypothetical protein
MVNSEEILHFCGLPNLRYPNNIVDADKKIFDSYLNQKIPNMEVKALKNVLVSPYGTIYKNFSMLLECTPFYFTPEDKGLPRFMEKYINAGGILSGGSIERLIRHFILCKKTNVRETHFWCSDQYSHYYMHWLSETLPRIYLLSLLEVGNPKVILPGPTMKNISFIKQSLHLLFPDIEFSFTENRNVFKFRELVWISQMGQTSFQFNPLLITSFREFIRKRLIDDFNFSKKRLYISRRNAICRKVLNEDEVEFLLKKFEFETVYLENYSFEEQMKICSQSDMIISIHGAGLSNMIFMPEDSFVLELQRRMSYSSCFFSLANALNLNYYYLFCQPDSEKVDGRLDNVNLHIDLNALENLVENMLSSYEEKKKLYMR